MLDKNTLLTIEAATRQDDPSASTAGTGTVAKIVLNDTHARGEVTVIADHLDLPTTFALQQDKSALWVVEAQYDHLFDKTDMPPSPFRVIKVPLK
jgi:hypothetical protein